MNPHAPRRVYLDHAATTPLSDAARTALVQELTGGANPSALHGSGRAARRTVEESREQIAAALGARPSEVLFTSGGTEADNLAVKGLYWGRLAQDSRRRRVVVSAVEHDAVGQSATWLAAHQGAELVRLGVDREGRVNCDALAAQIEAHGDEIALISVMWANNEVGTVQPISDVVRLARAHGIPVHSDAVQAVGQLDVNFANSGLSALSISGHKLAGPVGTGALLVRRDEPLVPLNHGGGHERALRSGTLNVAGIRACAVAVTEAASTWPERARHLAGLRDTLVTGLIDTVPETALSGPRIDSGARLANNAHLRFAGTRADSLLYALDSAGIEASAGSACHAGVAQPSHVLTAMGLDENAHGVLRLTVGATSTADDISVALAAIPEAVARARRAELTTRSST